MMDFMPVCSFWLSGRINQLSNEVIASMNCEKEVYLLDSLQSLST